MRTTAIVNSKGGTTKTTTAVNLATAAALAGQRVLLIDLDKQGSATQWLDHSPDTDALLDALLATKSLDELAVPTSVPGLELVPASASLGQVGRLQAEIGHQFFLRDSLAKTSPRDWVFIDSPGDLGVATIMALTAATEVLIPVPAGSMELDELPKVMETVETVRARLNGDLRIAGVLLTKFKTVGRHARVLSRDVAQELRRELPDHVMTTVVREDDRHGEAPAWRKPMAQFDPEGRGVQDYAAVLEELLGREAVGV